jgi:hypothetical protein
MFQKLIEMLNDYDFLKEKIQADTLLIFKGKKVKIVNEIDFNEPLFVLFGYFTSI